MKVLVACEESQRVCSAFRDLGFEAYSCDIQEPSGGHPEWHILGDVLPILEGGYITTMDGVTHEVGKWDLLIAHPPCTYLSNAGARHLYQGGKLNAERYAKGMQGREFFMRFYDADCEHICVENPIPSKVYNLPPYTQIIQPYEHGHPYSKRTCLWLKGLPKLQPTNVVECAATFCPSGSYSKNHDPKHRGAFTTDRAKNRSKTFEGIAKAIAMQFSEFILKEKENTMEFKLITDLSQLPQVVEFNAEELKAELSEKLTYYKNLVVTEDSIREAKSDRAKLSKLRDAIDTKRKEVKKACMAPYEAFETHCKEITAMISEPITSIDEQIKVFDQKELDAKHAELEKHFASAMAGCELPIELDKIINPKWQNKTMKLDTLRKEITECIEQIKDDVNGIKYAYGDTPHLDAVLKCYYTGYDAGAAHIYANQLIDVQRRREEQAMSAQQAAVAPANAEPSNDTPAQAEPVQSPPESYQSERIYTCRFQVRGTREQIRQVRDYMIQLRLQIESV